MADAFTRAKLRRLDEAIHDARLTVATRVVFYDIVQHINRVSGDAWPSELRLAGRLGLGIATVKRAISQLRVFGYIEIEKTGRHNTYRLAFREAGNGINLIPVQGAQGALTRRAPHETTGIILGGNRDQIDTTTGIKIDPLSSLREPHKEIFSKRDHHEPSFRSHAREATTTAQVGATPDGLSRKDDGAIHLLLIKEIGSDVVDALHAMDEGRPLKMLTAARRERPLTVIELDHARKLIEGTLHHSPKRAAS